MNHRPGTVLQAILGSAALLAAATAAYVAGLAPLKNASVLEVSLEPLSARELALALTRLRLDADTLAAAGLNATQARAAVDAVQEHLDEQIQTLRDADAASSAARNSADSLERLARSGQASPQDLDDLTSARAALAAAASARSSALDAAFAAATSTMTAEQRTALQAARANLAWDLPIAYLLAQRSDADWVALRDALANERIAARLGENTDQGCAALLASVRAENTTSNALAHLQEPNRSAVALAWDQAVND